MWQKGEIRDMQVDLEISSPARLQQLDKPLITTAHP